MNKNLRFTGLFFLAALLSLAILAGCGGTSSSSPGATPGNLTFGGNVSDVTDVALEGVTVQLASRSFFLRSRAVTTTTDADGNFTFTGVSAGNYNVSILQGDNVFTTYNAAGAISQSDTSAHFRVITDEDQWADVMGDHPYSTTTGYVIVNATSTTQDSVTQVVLSLSGTGGGYTGQGYFIDGNPPTVDWSGTSTTDTEAGIFDGVTPAVVYTAEGHRAGWNFPSATVTPVAGQVSIVFLEGTTATTYTVGGTLTETDNSTPIANATVTINSRSRGFFSNAKNHRYTVHTDVNGDYAFTGIPAGNYTIRCSKTNYVPLNSLVTVADNLTVNPMLIQVAEWDTFVGDGTHPYDADSGYILVQAMRQDNTSPIPGAAINSAQVYTSKGYITDTTPVAVSWTNTVTNNNGVAFFYETDAASYNFTATKTGYTFQAANGIVPIPGEVVFTPIMATGYPVNNTISGTIKEIDGTIVPEATVALVGTQLIAETNAQGAFTITNVTNGDYTIRVTKDDFQPTRSQLGIYQDLTGLEYPILQTAAFDVYHPTGVNMVMIKTVKATNRQGLPDCRNELAGPATYTDLGVFPGANDSIDFLNSEKTHSNGYFLFYDVADGGSDVVYSSSKPGYTFDDGAIPQVELTNGEVCYAVNQAYGPATFTVTGLVQSMNDHAPAGIRVELFSDPNINTTTDADGLFTLTGVPYGTQLFRINHDYSNTDYAKCNNYYTVTEDITYTPNERSMGLMCFTQAELTAMLNGQTYHPTSATLGYLGIIGSLPDGDRNIPKLTITASGTWAAQGYLQDSPAVVNWGATYAYTTQPVKIFYEGSAVTGGTSKTLTLTPTVYNPGWIFPTDETVLTFPGELTIKEVKAHNYPTRTFSGNIDDATGNPINAVQLVAQRHYGNNHPSLYTVLTGPAGNFSFDSVLPANDSQEFSLTKTNYLPCTVRTSLFADLTGLNLIGFDNAGFTAVFNTPESSHPYDELKTYFMVHYTDGDNIPVDSVTAVLTPAPGAGDLGYLDDGAADWSATSTTDDGTAIGYGYAGGSNIEVGGTHTTLNFEEMWAYGNNGTIVEILMQALSHP